MPCPVNTPIPPGCEVIHHNTSPIFKKGSTSIWASFMDRSSMFGPFNRQATPWRDLLVRSVALRLIIHSTCAGVTSTPLRFACSLLPTNRNHTRSILIRCAKLGLRSRGCHICPGSVSIITRRARSRSLFARISSCARRALRYWNGGGFSAFHFKHHGKGIRHA